MNRQGRQPGLERLDVLVGEWSIEASLAPAGPAGHSVFEWALGGRFLVQRTEVPHPEAPDSLAIVGLAPGGETYTQHYFDSRGVARVYAMTFRDSAWQLMRTAPDFTPLDFSQRFRGTLTDDRDTISGAWETSRDGSTWEHDFDLTYSRIGRPRSR